MVQEKDLPFLLKLLDDESSEVRQRVYTDLQAFGPELEELLAPLIPNLDPSTSIQLQEVYQFIRQRHFDQHWLEWLDEATESTQLLKAFSWLAYLQLGDEGFSLPEKLDALEAEYNAYTQEKNIEALIRFFFSYLGFQAPHKAYYNPLNSNLVHVLTHKQGLQISLSVLIVLLGSRLGLTLYGLNMPGHFMFCSEYEGTLSIHDPFNKGRPLSQDLQQQLSTRLGLEMNVGMIRNLRAYPFEIILRVLQNLAHAHQRKGAIESSLYYQTQFEQLQAHLKARRK